MRRAADTLTALRQALRDARAAADPAPAADADLAALLHHLSRSPGQTPIVAILGGTGTGKSTLLNRLLGREISAASWRRTHTAGPIAVAAPDGAPPPGWLGVDHEPLDPLALPARGRPSALGLVASDAPLLRRACVVDTPDLDGDRPDHHAQADAVFRWVDAIVLLVTPEKYQMPEAVPYWRLAERYGIGRLLVMNKCEQGEVLADCLARFEGAGVVFAIPRDGSTFAVPAGADLGALGDALAALADGGRADEAALRRRGRDALQRVQDQVIEPMRARRDAVGRVAAALRASARPQGEIDAAPMLVELNRRMRQRSVLYLVGPGRMLERLREAPALLARLPREAWDLVRGRPAAAPPAAPPSPAPAPGFDRLLADQFQVLLSRLDDHARSEPATRRLVEAAPDAWAEALLPPSAAAAIAEEEMAELRAWLEQRWNKTPRDTAMVKRLVGFVPGVSRLVPWTEAAPYVLAAVVATHHAFFGPVDLVVLGGWTLATWLGEKLSNEVAARARHANHRIEQRFDDLCRAQVERAASWLESAVPSGAAMARLEAAFEAAAEEFA